ncbi:hypothetical protein B0H14DRAFT_3150395 [Mycena olivaceomarginata]|nr:hypothetical protein B0H14DRAFT_3150395 [Mycena olivaceomarginata]
MPKHSHSKLSSSFLYGRHIHINIILRASSCGGQRLPIHPPGSGAVSFTVYAANRQTPSAKLGRVEDAIIATEKIQQHEKTNGARDQVKWMDYKRRLLDAKVSVSNIQTRLLEARSVQTWREYLEKVNEILQSIDECAKEVKEIQMSILLTIETERRHQLYEGIKEVRETIDATICSSMRHERTLTLRHRFESEAGNTDGPSMRVYQI